MLGIKLNADYNIKGLLSNIRKTQKRGYQEWLEGNHAKGQTATQRVEAYIKHDLEYDFPELGEPKTIVKKLEKKAEETSALLQLTNTIQQLVLNNSEREIQHAQARVQWVQENQVTPAEMQAKHAADHINELKSLSENLNAQIGEQLETFEAGKAALKRIQDQIAEANDTLSQKQAAVVAKNIADNTPRENKIKNGPARN